VPPLSETSVVALIGAILTAAVAITALALNGFLERGRRSHERTLGWEGRLFERRANTYAELLTLLAHIRDIILFTQPVLDRGVPAPEAPERPDTWRVTGLVAAFASSSVKEQVRSLLATQNEFFVDAEYLATMRQRQAEGRDTTSEFGLTAVEQYRKVDDIRKRFMSQFDTLSKAIESELASPPK
jgi:hypothetical protein